jgi:hypothetical protein
LRFVFPPLLPFFLLCYKRNAPSLFCVSGTSAIVNTDSNEEYEKKRREEKRKEKRREQ